MTDQTPRHYAPRHLIWSELTRAELAEARDKGAIVLIPTGSIEQHADHLPVETDAMLAAAVAEMAAARMTDTPVIVAPAVSFGFTPHHLSFAGTISLRLETYVAMLTDVAKSIIDSGFPRAMFINGHGGNSAPLRSICGQLTTDGYPVGMVDYTAPSDPAFREFMKGGLSRQGHACEHETAMMMDLAGEETAALVETRLDGLPARLIQPWIAPGHPDDPITDYGAGWAAIFQSDDCGYWGDPGVATRETGASLTEVTVASLAEFLEKFARTPLRAGVARDPAKPGIAQPTVGGASKP
ncbi:creatininase family protein [Pelagovum pacificum]|uniref:Creatininase family protein n=1 Tax=Pelagovum pacificum TaxID=2588711 RepID=A0A5C5G7D6_9RHOB|nr:creatininase family protein [Pelagovum pacificum]QQA41973.1 creatininase family protein [Pelagovum pacificum]TNY30586.1 creatininase family protein [Pelagovum pacificum]